MMMGGLLRGTLLVALVAVPSVGEKLVWGVNDGDEWYTRSCQKLELTKCKETYELCIREVPAGDGYSEAVCDCADEYYGVCSRQAGCASSLMTQCIDEMYRWQCPDSSICGSNCVDQGNTHIPPGSHVLPVNNFGQNALRFSVCFQTFNARSLNRYGMVVMEYCQPHDFHLCPYWVPPQTFTAIAIQHNASYLKMEFCVIAEGENGEADHYSCLEDPAPREYYGTETHWPSAIDVEFATAPYCGDDLDCPGSFCDKIHYPPVCAPHSKRQFRGPAKDFMVPPRGHPAEDNAKFPGPGFY